MCGPKITALKKHLPTLDRGHYPEKEEMLQLVIKVRSLAKDLFQAHHFTPRLSGDHITGFMRESPLLNEVLTHFHALVPWKNDLPEVSLSKMTPLTCDAECSCLPTYIAAPSFMPIPALCRPEYVQRHFSIQMIQKKHLAGSILT